MSALIYCNTDIVTGVNFEPRCSSGWVQIDATQTELLLQGGYDSEAFNTAFMGVLSLWTAGLAVGLIVGQIRKLKRG